ncbi:ribonuclease HIII [Lentibacillus sp. Marseille-P4043]|uniref:ribonuclease HIII n=1 Tax=Lentibacillus sp. Marseille-P4043 TaxID=2040293 RepID=UPI000D0B6E30|nr:ribonuclease HIII [Lentibacillus sp. Marseille-P4043]
MPQSVHVIPLTTIKEMQQYYANSVTDTPQGAVFRAKTPNAVITAYRSGKVLFQGKDPEKESTKWAKDNGEKSAKKKKHITNSAHKNSPPTSLFKASHIGSDEAGTGDYFGPITVACAAVNANQIERLKQIGVQDSKNLTDKTIKRIAKEIVKLDVPYSLLVLRNEKYNALKNKGWSQGKMKAMLHHHAIQNVLEKVDGLKFEGILIDQFCEPSLYKKYIASEQEKITDKTYFMTKAESYSIAVAAGSIIARTSFLNEMDKLSDKLGITLPKGASNRVDQVIANIINEKGHDILTTCAKTHFINTKKAEKYL